MIFREKDVIGAALGFILGLALIIGAAAGGLFGCGGMTQIDPPSLELQAGPTDNPPESILDDVEAFMVIC